MSYNLNTTLNESLKRIDQLNNDLKNERDYIKELEIQLINKQTLTTNIQKLEQILIKRIDGEYKTKYEKIINDKDSELDKTYNMINSLNKELTSYKNENADLVKFIQTQLDNLTQESIHIKQPTNPSAPILLGGYSYPTISSSIPPIESYTNLNPVVGSSSPPAYPGPPSDEYV